MNFHNCEIDPIFWTNSTPFLRWNIQKRITTDILNYLSSASSIIDVSRNFSRKELDKGSLEEYELLVKMKFVDNIEFSVLRKLRNYVQHYSLLDVGLNANWNYQTGKTTQTYLSTTILLGWKDWNSEERKFIQSHGEKIDIEPMIHKYQRVFMIIQDELHLRVLRTYVTEISKLVLEMEELYQKGLELKMMYNLPFRDRDIRYLKYIVNKLNTP